MKNKIESFLMENGAGQVGFCHIGDENPFGLPYAVSFTVPLSDAVVDEITDQPTHTYFHHYRTVNTFIDNTSLKVGLMLAREGFRYMCVPASQSVNGLQGIFSHKFAAGLSGLGTVGKSGLFLSYKFGPRVRLGTILTDCPFDVVNSEPKSICGDCRLCTDSCPAMAIRGEEWESGAPREQIVDAKACSDYMKKAFQHIGRGAVCGICMRVCPKGR
ncbi:MAG: epoxyqueuosine reductase [Clostridia bacterium]|nr:epoxyqueuosine reductase [Clostridia bacterium]MBR6523992.1 epoxyqueuosine reductase [Clostridia bacterium]